MKLVVKLLTLGTETILSIDGESMIVIGRSEDCDIIVSHETVSRRHCRLHITEKEIRVYNLSETNWTHINGKPVPLEGMLIYSEDLISLSDLVSLIVTINYNEADREINLDDLTVFTDETGRPIIHYGNMGSVQRMKHKDGCDVVVKRPKAMSGYYDLFMREASIAQQLTHKNTVKQFGWGFDDYGEPYLIQEYCDGGDLFSKVFPAATLSFKEATEIIMSILDALEYMHQVQVKVYKNSNSEPIYVRGIVHRDIKPQNILFQKSGDSYIVKVADFGLAKSFAAVEDNLTRTGQKRATPTFAPWIQWHNPGDVLPEVDIWSAAAVYFLC